MITSLEVAADAVTRLDLSRLDDALAKAARPEVARQMQGKLFLLFPDYKSIAFASPLAQPMRRYMAVAFARFPHLFYFLSAQKEEVWLLVAAHGQTVEAPGGGHAVALTLDALNVLSDALVDAAAFAWRAADDAPGIIQRLVAAGDLPPSFADVVLARAEASP